MDRPLVTQVLSEEHKVVLEQLLRLEAAIDGALDGVDLDAIEAVLGFFDGNLPLHRRKEEEVLFPLLGDRIGHEGGPVACMLHEHEIERGLVEELRDAAARARRGAASCGQARTAARAIVELLRNHIAKEDQILFPLAERALNELDKARVREGFARIGQLSQASLSKSGRD